MSVKESDFPCVCGQEEYTIDIDVVGRLHSLNLHFGSGRSEDIFLALGSPRVTRLRNQLRDLGLQVTVHLILDLTSKRKRESAG